MKSKKQSSAYNSIRKAVWTSMLLPNEKSPTTLKRSPEMSEISIPDVMDGIIYLTEIDKSLIREGKNGKYIPIRVKATPNNEYNDCMVTQRLPKEEREAGRKDPILGNVSVPDWLKEQQAQGQSGGGAPVQQTHSGGTADASGDLPF